MATICQHHVISCMHGLRENNLPQQPALARAGINPALLDKNSQRVHADQVAHLFKTVQETLDDEFMGFTQTQCKVGLFATMAELVSHCSTLGELLDKAINFYNLVSNDIPMKFDCFICLKTMRNKFMPVDENLFAAKLKYLQWGGGSCKERRKKLTNLI